MIVPATVPPYKRVNRRVDIDRRGRRFRSDRPLPPIDFLHGAEAFRLNPDRCDRGHLYPQNQRQ